jgi:hypothetical protein
MLQPRTASQLVLRHAARAVESITCRPLPAASSGLGIETTKNVIQGCSTFTTDSNATRFLAAQPVHHFYYGRRLEMTLLTCCICL